MRDGSAACRLRRRVPEQTRLEYGDDQYMLWRRSYDVPPPPLDLEQSPDARYRELAPDVLPASW
jgi:2,3-bisphosphoglycerate-dependent phosphoglycerate mutase